MALTNTEIVIPSMRAKAPDSQAHFFKLHASLLITIASHTRSFYIMGVIIKDLLENKNSNRSKDLL